MITYASFLFFSYAVASLWESVFHRSVLHAQRPWRKRWRSWGSFGQLLRLANFYHQTIHHRKTFRTSLLIQFDTATQREALDARLQGPIGRRARSDRYGLTVTGPVEFIAFAGTPLLVNSMLALQVESTPVVTGLVASVLPILLSRYLHPLLHRPAPAPGSTGLVNALCRTGLVRFLQSYHLLHHVNRKSNFNLLLGADWLLGRALRPRGHAANHGGEA